MSSLLKILVDSKCQVYCDYELIGEASPNSILRIELRKGNYILEFKQNDRVLLSKEYEMKSNDEECLLRVSLTEIVEKNEKDKREEEIAELNIDIQGKYWINNGVWLENKDTKEKTPIPYNVSEGYGFDESCLLNVNVGGKAEEKEVGLDCGGRPIYNIVYNGGRWGCVNKLGNIQIPILYDNLIYFYSPRVAVAQLNGKLLFIDKWNKIVFENTCDEVVDETPFLFGKCIIEKDGKQGIIDENGNEVLPLVYSKIIRVGQRKQFAVHTNEKWGLVDDAGKFLFPSVFDSIDDFYVGVYIVSIGNKVGLIDCFGRVVFPIVYDEIDNTWSSYDEKENTSDGSFILVKQDGLYGLYNKEKQILPVEFDEIKREWTPSDSKYDYLVLASKKHLWGVFDSLGRTVVPNKYNKVEYEKGFFNECFVVEKDGKWGYISIDGNTISPIYDSIKVHNYHLRCLIVQLGERFGLVSAKGEQLLPVEYISISIEPIRGRSGYEGYVFVMGEDGFGIYADDGSCIVEPVYKKISAGCGGFIVTDKDGETGLFDKKGGVVLPLSYEDIGYIDTGVIATKSNGVWQLWNYSKGDGLKKICWEKDNIDSSFADCSTPIQFKSYKKGQENQLIIEKEEKKPYNGFGYNNYAVIDYRKCNYVINYCDDIQKVDVDCYVFDSVGKKGLYNKEGVLLYECTYDEIVVKDELIYTIHDGCYLIYNYDGKVVFEKKYKKEDILYGVCGKCGDRVSSAYLVTKDGKWGCLNYDLGGYDIETVSDVKKVKEIVPCEYDYVAFQDKTLYTEDTKDIDMWIMYFVKRENNGILHYYKYQCNDNSADIIEEWVWPYANARYLFIDTETTGLPKDRDAFYYESDKWPYLVQISMIILDSKMEKIAEEDIVLAPENFTIPESASDIHGITNEYAQKFGKNRKIVLECIRMLFQTVEYVIGHNVDFDINVLKAELYRKYGDLSWFDDPKYKVIDTMKLGAEICKIPSYSYVEKYKWPTLDELYKALFGKTIQGRHNAMNDVKATEECFVELRRRKLI